MFSLVSIAVIVFLVTNLDDLIVLIAFCGHERYRLREIILGQYLGFGLLVVVSLVGGVGASRFFAEHVRWLGVFPIAVSVFWFLRTRDRSGSDASRRRLGGESNARSRTGLVAGVGLADGADNIAVYVPLFAVLELMDTVIVIGTFLIAAGTWVLFARWLASRPLLADRLDTYGDVVLPIVLMGLGVLILGEVI